MEHRGPDDEGTFLEHRIGLGHKRLSILDRSSLGHQPMESDDGRYVLTYNGEVYNYIELRSELEADFSFRSGTDTEVLLNAFRKWGEECLPRFNGMFAFAIYDRTERRLFAARDRFGIKPFYYHYSPGSAFIFGSEIPAVQAVMDRTAEAEPQVIFDYLAFSRTDHSDATFFKDINALPHGHSLWIDDKGVRMRRWYNLADHLDCPFASPDEFRESFGSAVRLRLRSDVPVGVCLSGGLDSSSIVSTLLQNDGLRDLRTFSAVYGEGQEGDETRYISEYRDLLRHMYFTTPTGATLIEDVERLVAAHNEPIPSLSPYAQFKVMQLAKGHVVVLLDGQGADEQLGGYHYFFGYLFRHYLATFRWLRLTSEVLWYLRRHRSTFAIKTFLYFLMPAALQVRARIAEKGYVDPSFASAWSASSTVPQQLYGSPSLEAALLDHFEGKLEHLLKWEDLNSMTFSLEARVPFLDHRIVQGTLALPAERIIRKGNTKHLLREAMKGVLPETIRTRTDKIGFGTPANEWLRTDSARELVMDVILSRSFRERSIVDTSKAEKLYSQHLTGQINIAKDVWKWVNLELWFREFIDSPTRKVPPLDEARRVTA